VVDVWLRVGDGDVATAQDVVSQHSVMSSSEAEQQRDALPLSVVDYEELVGSCVSLDDVLVVARDAADSGVVEDEFNAAVSEAVLALDTGLHARLIATGSSGSYYLADRQKVRPIV